MSVNILLFYIMMVMNAPARKELNKQVHMLSNFRKVFIFPVLYLFATFN